MSDEAEKDTGALFVVDGVTERRARLVAADDDRVHFTLPVRYLPAGTREGDHIRLRFSLDATSRKATASRVEHLFEELTRNQEDEPKKFEV